MGKKKGKEKSHIGLSFSDKLSKMIRYIKKSTKRMMQAKITAKKMKKK